MAALLDEYIQHPLAADHEDSQRGHYEGAVPRANAMAVAITGAAGTVGAVVREAFDPEQRQLLTHRQHEELATTVVDVGDRAAVIDALEDVDVLVHLAWGAAPPDTWTEGHPQNVAGTVNALEAAVANDVQRVVFASSIHAVGAANSADPSTMESTVADPSVVVDPEDLPTPNSYYGVAKVTCEALGRFYVHRYGLEVVSLRLGWLLPADELQSLAETATRERIRFARANWISPRDCRAVFAAAADTEDVDSPPPLAAISANADRYCSLTATMRTIGYRPKDDAAAVLEDGAER